MSGNRVSARFEQGGVFWLQSGVSLQWRVTTSSDGHAIGWGQYAMCSGSFQLSALVLACCLKLRRLFIVLLVFVLLLLPLFILVVLLLIFLSLLLTICSCP